MSDFKKILTKAGLNFELSCQDTNVFGGKKIMSGEDDYYFEPYFSIGRAKDGGYYAFIDGLGGPHVEYWSPTMKSAVKGIVRLLKERGFVCKAKPTTES